MLIKELDDLCYRLDKSERTRPKLNPPINEKIFDAPALFTQFETQQI
jgi:hypothetical protein